MERWRCSQATSVPSFSEVGCCSCLYCFQAMIGRRRPLHGLSSEYSSSARMYGYCDSTAAQLLQHVNTRDITRPSTTVGVRVDRIFERDKKGSYPARWSPQSCIFSTAWHYPVSRNQPTNPSPNLIQFEILTKGEPTYNPNNPLSFLYRIPTRRSRYISFSTDKTAHPNYSLKEMFQKRKRKRNEKTRIDITQPSPAGTATEKKKDKCSFISPSASPSSPPGNAPIFRLIQTATPSPSSSTF